MAGKTPPAGPPGGGGSGKLGAWISKHKAASAVIGGAGLGGAYLLYKHSAASQASTAGGTAGGRVPAAYRGGNPGNSSYGALEAQLLRLEEELKKLTQGRRHHHKHPKPVPDPHPHPHHHKHHRHPHPRPRHHHHHHRHPRGSTAWSSTRSPRPVPPVIRRRRG